MSAAQAVGFVASEAMGVIEVGASRGAVTLARNGGSVGMSPPMARKLGGLLERAADVAECSACGGSGVVARGDVGQAVPERPCRECKPTKKGGR